MFKKCIRFYAAINQIPIERQFYRVINRIQLLLYGLFPSFFYKNIYKKSQKIQMAMGGFIESDLLQESIRGYYSEASYFFVEEEGGCISLDILGVRKTFHAKDISHVDFSEGNNQLRRMSLGYCGFLHDVVNYSKVNAVSNMNHIIDSYSAKKTWHKKGVFKSYWHPYCVSHRIINYVSLLKYEEDAGLKIDVRLLIDEILFSLVFVEKNIEKELHYNHYSKNLIAIYVAKSVLGIDICQSFKNELKYSISHQVNADGMQAELSPMYNLLFLNDLKILCSIKGCDESLNRFFLETYDRIEVVAKLFFYNKNNLSVIGDSWVGEAARNFSVLNGNVTSILRDSGYLIHHSEKISFIFDFGKAGARSNPGHSHSDFLHTELYVNNNPVFVDYGVPTYSQGALRDYSRSSFAHNGPAIMESSLLETWSSFRTGRESSTSLVKYDKSGSEFEIKAIVRPFFRRKLQLSREIKYSKDALCIRDSWDAQMLDGFTPYLQFIVPKKSLMEFDSIESLSESNSIFLLDGWVIHFLALSIQFTECSYYSRYGIAENGIAIRITPKDYGTLKVSELHLVYGNK